MLKKTTLPPPTIKWVPVSERVPTDRRQVLAFGLVGVALNGRFYQPPKPTIFGVTRCNLDKSTARFDCEARSTLFDPFVRTVTHWSEIDEYDIAHKEFPGC